MTTTNNNGDDDDDDEKSENDLESFLHQNHRSKKLNFTFQKTQREEDDVE